MSRGHSTICASAAGGQSWTGGEFDKEGILAILNVTHDQAGNPRQSLSVAVKVAIGLGPDAEAGRKAPKKLDHFVFLRKTGAELEWRQDKDLTEHYRKQCNGNPREISVILLSDEQENVFRTQYAWWTATQRKCWSEMVQIWTGTEKMGEWKGDKPPPAHEMKCKMQATRRTEKHPEGELWAPPNPCGPGCPDLERGDCKPSGDLYFVLADFPMLGEVCRLHTSGYGSVRQLSSSLEQVRRLTGGRLTGMRLMLRVRPEKVTYQGKDKKLHRTTVFVLSLGVSQDDMRKLLAGMTEYAQMFESTRRLLGGQPPIEYEVEETEQERAPEIAAEFHPAEPENEQPEAVVSFATQVSRQKEESHGQVAPKHLEKQTGTEESGRLLNFRRDPAQKMVWFSGPGLALAIQPGMKTVRNDAGEIGVAASWFSVVESICQERGIELKQVR